MAFTKISPQKLPNFQDTPELLIQRAKESVDRYSQRVKAINLAVADVKPEEATFQSLILPIAHLENDFCSESWCLQFYQNVSPDPALREAAKRASMILNSETDNVDNISTYAKLINEKEVNLDPESQLFLESKIEYQNKHKDRISEITGKLNRIVSDFETNLLDDGSGIWIREDQLTGVPKQTLETLGSGTDENEGKLFVKYTGAAYRKVIEYATKPETRMELFIAKQNMHKSNAPLFKEAVSLRHERAVLRGFPNQAAYELEGNMIEDPAASKALIASFRERVAGIDTLDLLIEAKRKDEGAIDKNFYFWDRPYYDRIRRELDQSIDETQIPEYFPTRETAPSMFSIYEELFGIEFQKIDGRFWAEDVDLYAVWDDKENGGGFSGYLFLDLYERGGKYAGASNFGIQPSYLTAEGERRYAVNAMVCNFTAPSATRPSLLKHSEICTLFHELGHSMHAILSRPRYARHSGTCNAYDFTETPSLMLENWCWLPGILARLSSHWRSGDAIPDAMIQGILRTRDQPGRILDLYRVVAAAFDLAVHSPASQEEADALDPAALWNTLNCDIRGLKGPGGSDWGHGYASMKHSIANYPGSMITYIAGFCFADLVWDRLFAEDPMSRHAGRRWRREVLEPGGGRKPMDLLESVLDERPKIEDLCARRS